MVTDYPSSSDQQAVLLRQRDLNAVSPLNQLAHPEMQLLSNPVYAGAAAPALGDLSALALTPQHPVATSVPVSAMSPAMTPATPLHAHLGAGLPLGLASPPLIYPTPAVDGSGAPALPQPAHLDLSALQVEPAVLAAEVTAVGDDEEDTKL